LTSSAVDIIAFGTSSQDTLSPQASLRLHRFADVIEKAGLPEDCVLHGLRKTAARKLADAGATEEQIKSVTGHTTSRMVSHYTKGANQRKLAKAAILKLENCK
jgi:integrase